MNSRSDSTSTSLIEKVKAGEAAAWRTFVRLYGPLVYRWCRQSGFQPSDAEDVHQEVFVAVFHKIGQFDRDQSGGSFRGWLWTVTRNKLRDYLRLRKNQFDAIGGSDDGIKQIPGEMPDESSDGYNQSSALVHAAIEEIRQQMSPQTFQAFWGMTVDGQSARELGEDLDMTERAVRQAKYRFILRLREVLTDLMD